MERNKKIFMQSWLRPHPRAKSVSTDEWYLDFANRLFSLIGSSQPYIGKRTEDIQRAAIMLTLYLEDSIANAGGWRHFATCVISYMVVTFLFMSCRKIIFLMR